ncbi:MAG: ATP-binding protein [Paracoccaceae bacterium]|nr:ATP-binding protein [Paracoccaceae bacterium]
MTDIQTECFDDIAASVFVLEPDQTGVPRYVIWNTTAELESGLNRDSVLGRTARDVYAGSVAEIEYQRHLVALRTGESVVYDINDTTSGASKRRCTTLKAQHDCDGSILRLIGTIKDTTAEHEARNLRTRLASLSGEAEQFVALAAHDLRTPMRNISILADMLREDFEDRGDGKLELIDLLEEVAEKSGGLLREILTHTQDINASAEVKWFDFEQLCQTLIDVLDPLSMHSIVAPKIWLFSDKTAMQIVLRNLFDNALKHGQKSNLSIIVDVQQSSFDTLSIQVQDNGQGFEGAGRALLDTGPFRADKGYGLLGIRRLLTARGGTIRSQDRSDRKGCTISFTLPGQIDANRSRDMDIPKRARKTG